MKSSYKETYSVSTNLTLHGLVHRWKNRSFAKKCQMLRCSFEQSDNYKYRLETLSDGSMACIRLFPFYRLEMQRTCKCGFLMNDCTSEQSSTPFCCSVRSDKFLRTKSDNFQTVFDLLTLCSSS